MDERSVAIAAVRAAVKVCQSVQARLVTPETLQKKDKSPVTVADFASQAIVCRTLRLAFANDPIVAEEDSADLRGDSGAPLRATIVEQVSAVMGRRVRGSEILDWIDLGRGEGGQRRFWTLDPIDGTKGFLRREQYAVALALIEDGEVVLGALACPNLQVNGGTGIILVAEKGKGTKRLGLEGPIDETPARVSDTAEPQAARFCESVESGHTDQQQSSRIARQLSISSPPLRMDSQAKYAAIALGQAQIYLRLPTREDYRERIWDHAAGMLAVQEAGGTVTDIDGKPLDFSHGRTLANNRGVVASSGRFHDRIISAIHQA